DFYDQECPTGTFMSSGWNTTMFRKVDLIIRAIKENWQKIFIHADVDIQFFAETKSTILSSMLNQDLAIQRDDIVGNACAGFFACRGNEKTLKLWQEVKTKMMKN